ALPCLRRGAQAALSANLGAPAMPAPWQAEQVAVYRALPASALAPLAGAAAGAPVDAAGAAGPTTAGDGAAGAWADGAGALAAGAAAVAAAAPAAGAAGSLKLAPALLAM